MAVGILPHSPPTLSQASEQGYVGQVLMALIDAVKKVWAQVVSLIQWVFYFATCGRYVPLRRPPVTGLTQPLQRADGLPAPVVEEVDLVSMKSRNQFPLGGLPTEIIQLVFVQCLSKGDIKAFNALTRTNVHSYVTMRKLVNEVALTHLCTNLRILDARTFTFHADLRRIDKYKVLQSYYKLEPFVEGRAGLTMILNQGGLTLKDMKENNCGIVVDVWWNEISEELDNIPEEDIGPEMISNAPITESRDKRPEVQEARVRDEVGFDGKPTLIQYLALLLATQKELGICLYGEEPSTFGRASTQVRGYPLLVGGTAPGRIHIDRDLWGYEFYGAGGRRKL